jgi:hypothetical protein
MEIVVIDKEELRKMIFEIVDKANRKNHKTLDKEFLTAKEAAEFLGVKVGTIYNNANLKRHYLDGVSRPYFSRKEILEGFRK